MPPLVLGNASARLADDLTSRRARPVRVCFMIDRLRSAGTETQLVALIQKLDRRRVLPHLCLLDGEDAQSRLLEPGDCPILRLGVRSLVRPRSVLRWVRLIRFLRQERIDVLQVYFKDSSYFGVPAARLAGIPAIVRTRNNLGHSMTGLDRFLARRLKRWVTATVANCDACREAVIADERLPLRSVTVIENGVDLERFEIAGQNHGTPRKIGVVANLRRIKGLDLLIEAAARLSEPYPDLTFEVAGEGEERPELERLLAERGLAGRFRLLGSVADIPGFLASLDVAVLCSRAEGMPNAILEYMAAGLPIVATRVGGVPRLIEDGICGVLVAPDNAKALTQGIKRLLADGDLAAGLGRNARGRVESEFSRQSMVRRFEDFFESLAIPRALH